MIQEKLLDKKSRTGGGRLGQIRCEWDVIDWLECTLRRKRVQQLQREGVACFITYLKFLLIIKDGFKLSVIKLFLCRSGVIFGS